MLTDREGDLAPGAQELVGELQAGGGGADDEHAAGFELSAVVVDRRDLL